MSRLVADNCISVTETTCAGAVAVPKLRQFIPSVWPVEQARLQVLGSVQRFTRNECSNIFVRSYDLPAAEGMAVNSGLKRSDGNFSMSYGRSFNHLREILYLLDGGDFFFFLFSL